MYGPLAQNVSASGLPYLKDGEQSGDDGVEVGGGRAVGEVELSAEELHSQQGEDEDEQEEQEQE